KVDIEDRASNQVTNPFNEDKKEQTPLKKEPFKIPAIKAPGKAPIKAPIIKPGFIKPNPPKTNIDKEATINKEPTINIEQLNIDQSPFKDNINTIEGNNTKQQKDIQDIKSNEQFIINEDKK